MQERSDHKIWQTPWGYSESIIITCGIVAVGFLLQVTVGYFNFYFLASPVNLLVGGAIVAFCVAFSLVRGNNFIRWFTGVPLSVCLIVALLGLTLIMGLTPQASNPANVYPVNIFALLGFNGMTASWAFVLIYFVTLLSLGSLIACKVRRFRLKDYAFHMSHTGFWLVLFASGLGYSDMESYVMHVREGEVEWRVYDDDGNVKELPVAIQLNDFDMEEYPPKLTVIDRGSGIPQPEAKPDYYQIDTGIPEGRLDRWDIKLEQYIHSAVRSSDSTYREVPMPGATPAARITALNMEDGTEISGWVSGGNQAQLYMTLPLDEKYCVVMTVAEPKRFMSDIEVYRPDGSVKKGLLEVNKPIRTGSWTIYQYDYDDSAGRLSSYSSMELVYDPWVIPVYAGFILIALGAAAMIWNGRPSKLRENAEAEMDNRN